MFKTAIQLSGGAWFLKKHGFWEIVDFFSNLDLEQILYESFVATFRQLRQKSNPSVYRNILNKKCFLFDQNHFFLVYGLSQMRFWTSKENYFVSFVNTAFNVSRGTIEWNSFLKRIRIVLPFGDFEWKISWISAGKLCHSCRKCSCVSRLRFPVFFVKSVQFLFVLFKFWLIQLHLWQIFVRQGLQNCTLCARRSFRGKTFGLRIFLSILQPFPDFTERLPVLWR